MRTILRWCLSLTAVGLVALAAATPIPAQDRDAAPLDRQIYDTLRDVINAGADLYNLRNDRAGCYRLYQGSLVTLRPLLGHHPELQKAIDAGLASADRAASDAAKAFALRGVIDEIRNKTGASAAQAVKPAAPKTLWDRLGGEKNVRKVVDDFVAASAADPKVAFDRGGKYKLDAAAVADLKQKLVEMLSEASGGPLKYTGRSMKEVHKGMGVSDAEFNALAVHLVDALRKHGASPADVDAVVQAVAATRKDIVEPKKVEPKPAEAKKADVPAPSPVAPPAARPMTVWDRLGGEKSVRKVVDDFVKAAAADPKVDFDRGGKFKLNDRQMADLKLGLVEMLSVASGGPLKYAGRNMKDAHQGMGITDEQFNALAGHLRAALQQHGAAAADVNAILTAVEATRKDIVDPKKPEPKKPAEEKKKAEEKNPLFDFKLPEPKKAAEPKKSEFNFDLPPLPAAPKAPEPAKKG